MLEKCVIGLKHDKLALGVTIGQLKQENEGLSIRLESLEKDLAEKRSSCGREVCVLRGFVT